LTWHQRPIRHGKSEPTRWEWKEGKGRRLGIFKPHEEKPKKAREKERDERFWIEVLGRPVPATNTDDGIRPVRGRPCRRTSTRSWTAPPLLR
jgi:hypothetical protein